MKTFCFARNEVGQRRVRHNPVAGLDDGKPVLTCAWCGKTLKDEEPPSEDKN